jgi:hypothetical protein
MGLSDPDRASATSIYTHVARLFLSLVISTHCMSCQLHALPVSSRYLHTLHVLSASRIACQLSCQLTKLNELARIFLLIETIPALWLLRICGSLHFCVRVWHHRPLRCLSLASGSLARSWKRSGGSGGQDGFFWAVVGLCMPDTWTMTGRATGPATCAGGRPKRTKMIRSAIAAGRSAARSRPPS